MIHGLFLCKRLQFEAYLFILMHPIGRLIMTVMTESYYKTKPIRFITKSCTKHMMPFKPYV